jgi:hypothetical protein
MKGMIVGYVRMVEYIYLTFPSDLPLAMVNFLKTIATVVTNIRFTKLSPGGPYPKATSSTYSLRSLFVRNFSGRNYHQPPSRQQHNGRLGKRAAGGGQTCLSRNTGFVNGICRSNIMIEFFGMNHFLYQRSERERYHTSGAAVEIPRRMDSVTMARRIDSDSRSRDVILGFEYRTSSSD